MFVLRPGGIKMRFMLIAVVLCLAVPVWAQDAPLIPATFEWPEAEPDAIPDLRVNDSVVRARETAREATTRASEGRRAAAATKRRAGLQSAFGVKPQRATIDDETEIAMTRGSPLGSTAYPTGATLTGDLSAGLGVYRGYPESPLNQFSGWVFNAGSGSPRPIDGIFEWKNGDVFTGSMTGDGSTSAGVYVSGDGERRFVGIIDFSQSEFRPVRGYLENAKGKLLAVVKRDQ